MKLKLLVLLALFVAGVFASFALADNGKPAKKAEGKCHEVHISGTIAPQTLVVTVDKASAKSLIAAGTQLSLAVGSTGQTVRVKAEACATGTGSSLALTIKQVELRPDRVKAVEAVQTATQEKRHKGEDEHQGKKGVTTTTSTATTTTSAGTTTTSAGTTTTSAGTARTTP